MKLQVIDNNNNKVKEIELPSQFDEEVRPDLIKRAVITIQNNTRQKYGSKPDAGMRASAKLSKRRKAYRTSYGFGISRTPRKIMLRRGRRLNWVGAVAPNTVGGRRAHAPKAEKEWSTKINTKERRKAIRSAMAATLIKETVLERGHLVPDSYPFIVDSKIESLSKAKEISEIFKKIGLEAELERVKEKRIRAGKGKSRGRKYAKKRGPLLVVSKESKVMDAAKNIPGIEIVEVKDLNTELLAPGANPGRITLWSEAAINILQKEGLFL